MKKFNEIFLEATTSFDKVIKEAVPDDRLAVSKKYKIPTGGGILKIDKKDQEIFKKLFRENAGSKGVGNGEVSLYWVFNYYKGVNQKRCKENRGDDAADLVIDNIPCEVKSYPRHTGKVGLGKFKNAYEFRELLSIIFGINSLFQALGQSKKGATSFNSEIQFGHENLVESFKQTEELYDIINSNTELIKNL